MLSLSRWTGVLMLSGAILTWCLHNVVACDCAPPPPPKDALKQATVVALAKAVKLEGDAVSGSWKVTLQVERWWKGGEGTTLHVITSKSGAACGYRFDVGNSYLIYAHGEVGKQLAVSQCSRTRTLPQAQASGDLKELGEGKAP